MYPIVVDSGSQREFAGGYELRFPGWTEERYWAEAPSDRFCEFVDGEVVMPSPVDVEHQRVVGLLQFLLSGFCGARAAGTVLTGPTAIRLRPGLAREPDLFVVAPVDAVSLQGSRVDACPILIVEVAGFDSERRDLVDKTGEYAARGVPEYWVVLQHRKQVVVHRPAEPGREHLPEIVATGRVGSTALPGFWVDSAWLWQPSGVNCVDCLKTVLGDAGL